MREPSSKPPLGRREIPEDERRAPFAVRLPRNLILAFDKAIAAARAKGRLVTKTSVVEDAVLRFLAIERRKEKR